MSTQINTSQRIQVIDVLRGITLLGIILVHFTEQYYAGQPPKIHENFVAHNLADMIVLGFIGILISGKFFMIFSFLFGISFFIQLDKSEGSSTFLIRFTWRLMVLFGIGFLHHLHYRGNILTIYAILGIGLLLCYKLSDKWLLIVALLLVFNIPSLVIRGYSALVNPQAENPFLSQDEKTLELYYRTLKTGSYYEIVKANFYEFKGKFGFQIMSGRIYITMGLFLLGLFAGRKGIFEKPEFFKKLMRYGFWILLGCIIVAASLALVIFALKVELVMPYQFLLGGAIFDVFNAALASIYVGLIVTLYQKEEWKIRLMHFYDVGRMGLTTYILQAVVGTLIFFSFGLGMLGDYGASIWALLALVVFFLQIQFSRWWLQHFQFGPIEWLWRCLTYARYIPNKVDNLPLTPKNG